MIYGSQKSKSLILQEWTGIKLGNYIEYNYYAGHEAGNPSGNANLKEMKYFDKGSVLKHHIIYSWDSYDNIIKQESIL